MGCCDDVAGFCPFAVDAFHQALFPVSGRTYPSSQGGGDKDRAIVALSTVDHEHPILSRLHSSTLNFPVPLLVLFSEANIFTTLPRSLCTTHFSHHCGGRPSASSLGSSSRDMLCSLLSNSAGTCWVIV